MPTPFICQKCAARIAKSTIYLPRSHQISSHTKGALVKRLFHADIPPPSSEQGGSPEFSQHPHDNGVLEGSRDSDSTSSTFSSPVTVSQEQGNGNSNIAVRWNAVRYIRDKLQPAADTRKLKEKILAVMGSYEHLDHDLRHLYRLSAPEARHAVGQLERLRLDSLDISVAARQLDKYLIWKKDFSAALRNIVNSVHWDLSSMADLGHNELTSMRMAWQRLDQRMREERWPQMILSALGSEPRTFPAFIQSTFDPSWCPSYVVEDMLYLLHRRHQLTPSKFTKRRDDMKSKVGAIGLFILDNCPPGYLVLEQTALLLISSSLSISKLSEFLKFLQNIDHPLNANTLLQFASRFAKGFDTKLQAVDILHFLTGVPGFDLNTPSAASVCTSLLGLNENEPLPDNDAAPDVFFKFLLEKGFQPNILQLSALMRNFCIRGHIDTAWEIFRLMIQYGLQPDHYVYSILFNGAKKNSDSALTERLFYMISSRSAWSPVLVNDFLDLLYRENEWQVEQRRRQRKKLNNAWRPMLQLYAKFYDLAPLQRLTSFPLENLLQLPAVRPNFVTNSVRLADSVVPLPADKLMQPDGITICLMLGAHMRSLLSAEYAYRYYIHFLSLVKQKNPAVLSLLAERGTMVHDIFIRTLVQFRTTIHFAVKQLWNMINDAAREKEERGYNLHYHRPSVHTWTIIINGYKNHRNARSAVNIFKMMTSIGQVEPTLATWNALIQVYARARNVNAAVRAVVALEKAGLQPNDRTIKAFDAFPRYMRDQAIKKLGAIRKASDTVSPDPTP
ncbi:hypothetical protein GGS21DRAFT_504494 [Xylaria nigripes]|nr:hypothetical protein GGS21DRAFT_504494 [Xylaria nigripes]